jgi:phospholipid/cholesterol/gamma-HCH transport system ATP-binding protein
MTTEAQALPQNVIELVGVVASSQGYETLKGVNCSFKAGRATVIMGSSGSGKSTLIKVAAGLVVPDAGEVLYRGKAVSSMGRRELDKFYFETGFAFQDSALWSNQSIKDNLALPVKVVRPGIKAAELDLLLGEAVRGIGFEDSLSQRPAQLSLGEQKLISIARAMIIDPEVLFMDEPMAFLDDAACERVTALALDFKDRGKTLVVVTHSLEFAAEVADDILVVHQGKAIAQGSYEELTSMEDGIVHGVLRRASLRGKTASVSAPAGEGEIVL